MAMTLITTNPDSTDVDAVEFTSGIDSTYKLYIFKFYDINPATDSGNLRFQGNASGESGYNEDLHTTFFYCRHDEAESVLGFAYNNSYDQENQSTFAYLAAGIGSGADESAAGTLWLFNPSNTTYVKHFYAMFNLYADNDFSYQSYIAGYFNTTAAITNIKFAMESGNFDGVIKMYGVS